MVLIRPLKLSNNKKVILFYTKSLFLIILEQAFFNLFDFKNLSCYNCIRHNKWFWHHKSFSWL